MDAHEPSDGPRCLFEDHLFHSPRAYRIAMDEKDREHLARWKECVDRIIHRTKEILQTNSAQRTIEEEKEKSATELALGHSPTDTDINLYGIGSFLVVHQRLDPDVLRLKTLSALKFLFGGTHHLREFETGYNTRVDVSAVTKALAEMYGIPGNIRHNLHDPLHYYWQEKSHPQETAHIIDTYCAKHRNGLVYGEKEHRKHAERCLTAERRKLRKRFAIFLPWNWGL